MAEQNTARSGAQFQVVWPLGRQRGHEAAALPPQRRLPHLNDATMAFVWNYGRKGDQMFETMRGMLGGEYPDMSFVGHEVFGDIHGPNEAQVMANLPELLRAHKADVAVVGVGG